MVEKISEKECIERLGGHCWNFALLTVFDENFNTSRQCRHCEKMQVSKWSDYAQKIEAEEEK